MYFGTANVTNELVQLEPSYFRNFGAVDALYNISSTYKECKLRVN